MIRVLRLKRLICEKIIMFFEMIREIMLEISVKGNVIGGILFFVFYF